MMSVYPSADNGRWPYQNSGTSRQILTLEGSICKTVTRMLQGCYKGVTRVLQGCCKGVARVLQGCYKGVAMVLQGCYQCVTGIIQGCFKVVTRMQQGCDKGFDRVFMHWNLVPEFHCLLVYTVTSQVDWAKKNYPKMTQLSKQCVQKKVLWL